MSYDALTAMRARVVRDEELAQRLRSVSPEAFVGEVVRSARTLGYDVTDEDVQDAIAASGRAWLLRWIA